MAYVLPSGWQCLEVHTYDHSTRRLRQDDHGQKDSGAFIVSLRLTLIT